MRKRNCEGLSRQFSYLHEELIEKFNFYSLTSFSILTRCNIATGGLAIDVDAANVFPTSVACRQN